MSDAVDNGVKQSKPSNQFVELYVLIEWQVASQEGGAKIGDAIPQNEHEEQGTVQVQVHTSHTRH